MDGAENGTGTLHIKSEYGSMDAQIEKLPATIVDSDIEKVTTSTNRQSDGQLDGKYAWLICLASFWIYTQSDGIAFSLGIFTPIFLDAYGETVQFTMWISSIMISMITLSGPFAGYLVSKFGSRLVCCTGGFLASAGVLISQFATGVWFLIGTLGIMSGLGFGLMIIPALTSVMTWFEKRRPLAVGCVMVGSGVGMFIYPKLVALLLDHYTLSGCFLIIGALILNSAAMGFFMKLSPIFETKEAKAVNNQFDISIFRNLRFDLFLLACFTFGLGYFPIFLFIARKAEIEVGLDSAVALELVPIIGFAHMGGRIFSLLVLGRRVVNSALAVSIVALVGGMATTLSHLMTNYVTAVAFCAVYGFSSGFSFLGMPVVMSTLITPVQMSIGSGFFVFAIGVSSLCGINGAGILFEYTGHKFITVFSFAGAATCLSAACFFLIFLSPLLRRR